MLTLLRSSAALALIGAAVVTSVGCQQQAEESAELTDADLAAINKTLDAIPSNYLVEDLDGLMAVYTADAVILEYGRIDRGAEAIRNDHIKDELDNFSYPIFRSADRVIRGNNRIAYVYERYILEAKNVEGETVFQGDSFQVSHVLEKQPDGSWKIVLGHFSGP